MIDVEHGALCALEQDAAARLTRLVEPFPDRLGVGQDARGDGLQLLQQVDVAARLAPNRTLDIRKARDRRARHTLSALRIARKPAAL